MQRNAAGDARTALRVAQGLLAGTLQLSGEQRGTADRLAMAASWALYMAGEGTKPIEAAEYQLAVRHALAVIGNPSATVADPTAARINRAAATMQYAEVKNHFPDDTGVVVADLEELYQTVDERRRPLVGALLAISTSRSVAVDVDGAAAMRQIALIEEVLRYGNAVAPLRINLLLTLGFMLVVKVEAGNGNLADLDRAAAVFREVLTFQVEHPAHHMTASGGLGVLLATRAAYGYGRQSDLNDAIES